MAESFAKLSLRSKVIVSDAVLAIFIYEENLASLTGSSCLGSHFLNVVPKPHFSSSFSGFEVYSQNHVKCSRPLCSLPGLQGQKFFEDAIINFLIPFKYISDKNSYNQLFINEVVKIFTFQFDESIIKFYLVKFFQILMKFW